MLKQKIAIWIYAKNVVTLHKQNGGSRTHAGFLHFFYPYIRLQSLPSAFTTKDLRKIRKHLAKTKSEIKYSFADLVSSTSDFVSIMWHGFVAESYKR